MILRRITVERYGCFGSGEFEFRRGLNLICGGNETGKSLLLATLPAVVLGVEHGMRLRSWGDSLSCRASLLFEASGRAVRLSRELESNLVRLEEQGADGQWREGFAGRVPPGGKTPDHQQYFDHLERLFGVAGMPLLRALLDSSHGAAVFDGEGRMAEWLAAPLHSASAEQPAQPEKHDTAAARQAEIAALEAELATDREEYRKGQEYLAWVRKRWEKPASGSKPAGKSPGGQPAGRTAALAQQHRDLAMELQRQGVPLHVPADLAELLATADELRQELAALQLELAPLQRSHQALAMPASTLPLAATLVALAAPGIAYYLNSPWLVALASGGAVLLLLCWGVFLVRLNRVRGTRAGLDREIGEIEQRRSAALTRQSALAERFVAAGLPSTPVEMVKLQQLCQRNQAQIERYQDLGRQLGLESPNMPTVDQAPADDRHLRPEELPDAEKRLADLSESLRRREARLQALHNGGPALANAGCVLPASGSLTVKNLLPAIGQLLDRLTNGRYREVRLEDERCQLEASPGQWVSPSACSRGTVEALALAFRLALYQMIGARLPLPLDDLPASFEPRRRQATLRLLERLAADHQVLLATCDDELARRAARERWQVVDLKLKKPGQAIVDKETADAGQLHLL